MTAQWATCVGCTRRSPKPIVAARDGMYMCRPCRRDRALETHSIALTGGRWVRRGLVSVWVPSDPLEVTR